MAILLLVFSFIAVIINLFNRLKSLTYSFLLSIILISTYIVFSSEVTSFFNIFNYNTLMVCWASFLTVNIYWLFRHRNYSLISNFIDSFRYGLKLKFKAQPILFGVISFLFALLFFQSIIYPPNNYDSMTYHMSRVAHWVMNSSVYPYPTHIYRQVYQPPFAEWFIAQVCILNKSDLFANSIQFFFLLGIFVLIIRFVKLLNLSVFVKWLCLLLVISIPEVILQATSTQNDLVLSFFILYSIYATFLLLKDFTIFNLTQLALSIGFSLLTKGTSFIYLLPIGIWILIMILKTYKIHFLKTKIHFFVLAMTLILLVPFGHYFRNFFISGSIFGNPDESYFNERFYLNDIFLNQLKNFSLHFGFPGISHLFNQIIEKIHLVMDVKIDFIETNFNGLAFKLNSWAHSEDDASNFFQILFYFASFFLFIKNIKKINFEIRQLFYLSILSFITFSLLLKWQPWHTRLQLPFFVISVIPITQILFSCSLKKNWIRYLYVFFIGISFLYGFFVLIFNPLHPLVKSRNTYRISIWDDREHKYFAMVPSWKKDYDKIRSLNRNPKNCIAWDVHGDTWVYPIYQNIFSQPIQLIQSTNFNNPTRKLSNSNRSPNYYISQKKYLFSKYIKVHTGGVSIYKKRLK